MRVLSSLGLIASLVLFTDAAAVEKRAISAPVQTCISDIGVLSANLDAYANVAAKFDHTQGYRGALGVHLYNIYASDNLTKNAIPHCCDSAVSTYTAEEATGIINSIYTMAGKVASTMQIMTNKQPEFAQVLLMNAVIKNGIGYINGNTTAMDKCLIKKAPANAVADLTQYVNQIEAAYESAYAVYAKHTGP